MIEFNSCGTFWAYMDDNTAWYPGKIYEPPVQIMDYRYIQSEWTDTSTPECDIPEHDKYEKCEYCGHMVIPGKPVKECPYCGGAMK